MSQFSNGWTEPIMQTEQRKARILAATVPPVDLQKFNLAMLFIELQETKGCKLATMQLSEANELRRELIG